MWVGWGLGRRRGIWGAYGSGDHCGDQGLGCLGKGRCVYRQVGMPGREDAIGFESSAGL